ncbi:MAG: hypothetical protein IPK19_00020 [Chloroflexi bacterium]|nr:hypothetical protein [Chloroflexota bacterium]
MVNSKRFLSIFVLLGATLLLMTPAVATEPGSFDTYDQTLFLDTGWYRESLITSADLWNGGLDAVRHGRHNGFFTARWIASGGRSREHDRHRAEAPST